MLDQESASYSEQKKLRGAAAAVQNAYAKAADRPLSNRELYKSVSEQLQLDLDLFTNPVAAPEKKEKFSTPARTVRWVQQTLKARGLLERSDTQRGVWRLTPKGKIRLHHVDQGQVLVAFHTRLGIALLADCRSGFASLGEPIHLCLTSPPYPLAKEWGRAYGSPKASEYVDFICEALEPIVAFLAPGGSIALNISNDIFEPGSPARSLYQERLILAMYDRLGLSLMDRLIWWNPVKAPGPVAWASLKRFHLNATFEPVLWFCNDPLKTFADNRRVLQPHTERHKKLIAKGGEQSYGVNADGAHIRRPGDFGRPTEGRIPRNLMEFPHSCLSQRRYKSAARNMGLPVHGAPYPLKLAEFLVAYLTEESHLVADPFAGSHTTARAAENLGRRWVSTEIVAEYARGGALRFGPEDDAWLNPDLDLALAHAGVGVSL